MTDSFPSLQFFQVHEFDSPDEPNSGERMDHDFVCKLDLLRQECGFPFRITSGFRTEKHNAAIKGAQRSAHLLGRAVDISCGGGEAYAILKLALKYGFFGIGIKQHGAGKLVHLDDIGFEEIEGISRPTLWTYP